MAKLSNALEINMIHNKQITHVCLKKVRRSKKKKDRTNVRKMYGKLEMERKGGK